MSGRRGLFVVLEGIDGSGSTTQLRHLARALGERGHDVRTTFEPSPGPVGQLIRSVLTQKVQVADPDGRPGFAWRTLALLFAADRLDHVGAFVEPALAEGALVLCDRYTLSSLAYQSATSAEAAAAVPWIRELNRHAPRPDLTLVLDVDAEVAEQRRLLRGGAAELFERRLLQQRLAEVYRAAEALVPDERVAHVDGARPEAEVTAALLAHVEPLLPSG